MENLTKNFIAKVATQIQTLVRKFPFVTDEVIGTSRLGAPLQALCVGYGATHIGYNAAHHANEWITALLLLRFVREYCTACTHTPALLEKFTLYAIPLVNPDGVQSVTQRNRLISIPGNGVGNFAVFCRNPTSSSSCVPPVRCVNDSLSCDKIHANLPTPFPGIDMTNWKANACGVDLNANYPASWEAGRDIKAAQGYDAPGPRGYPGTAPLCEPESSAMAAYTQLRDFALTISLHTQGEEIYHRYRHYNPPGAEDLAAQMAQASRYPLIDVPDESSHGGYRDWFIEWFNRPGFTIECGLGDNPLPAKDFAAIYKDVAPLLWVPFI